MAFPSETILYVDDDDDSRHAFGWLFRRAGFDVKEVATGSEALRLARDKPDLIVLDVNLPDISGLDVCRQIKLHPATASIPVLHLSAYFISSEDRVSGLDGGADGYLTKPVDPEELLAQVKSLMRRHRAEEAALTFARQWQAMFDALRDGVCLLDKTGKVLRCNQAMAHLLGRPSTAIIGASYGALVDAALGAADASVRERILDLPFREGVEVRLGGRWLRLTADPVRDENGAVAGSVHLHADITERKHLEEQLRQSQKMEGIGRLAGGIAHDFNNLLTAITGNASVVLSAIPKDDPNREALRMIEEAGWRAATLTRQLLGFSRQTMLWLQPIDLGRCVREMIDLLRRTIDPRIALEVRTDPALGVVQADATAVGQVLMNLCLNARDAMPDGGHLILETENVSVSEEEAVGRIDARAGELVRLRVRDTGTGIAPEVMPRIFEPFFTTKPLGQGTGLGLAMAFGIVKQHGGWIECDSAVNGGSCFDIYLPRAVGTASSGEVAPPPPRGGSETILLVEDQAMIRDVTRTILQGYGYKVLHAEDGLSAAALYQAEHPRIKLVVLDMSMPGLSGTDTARELVKINPDVGILLVSGYAPAQVPASDDRNVLGFLAKPYRATDLARKVRAILDGQKDQAARA